MLRRARRCHRYNDDGQASIILLTSMTVGMALVAMVFFRLGHAGDLRTKAQNAADAAALAAAGEIADNGAALAGRGLLPYGTTFDDGSRTAADRYAARNNAQVDEVRPSGTFGHTVRVRVHTNECQTDLKDDPDPTEIVCPTPTPGVSPTPSGRHGTATAFARAYFPRCTLRGQPEQRPVGRDYVPRRVTVFCDGRRITSAAQARRLFKVRLVDHEDSDPFIPSSTVQPTLSGGNLANQELGRRMAEEMGWTGQEWECLRSLWIAESGWNHLAHNPSGAHGIPQALPASKMAASGSDYMTNPVTQIRWGLSYIASHPRYGTPCRAWAWWQRTDPRPPEDPHPGHWY